MAGEIVHLEIPTDDTSKGREFWGGLFGWQFENMGGGQGDYFMTRIGDQQGVAVSNMEGDTQGTRPYFAVEEINAGAAKVRDLGGEADDPQPVPNMGWFSTCKDPHGNKFGLWQTDPSAG